MHRLSYRTLGPGLSPRRTELVIPGWAGQPEPRAEGRNEQPWHCTPFSDAAKYGFEVFYPYQAEMRVRTRRGRLIIDADFGPAPNPGATWPPVINQGDIFFILHLLLDLKTEPGLAFRTEPHARFYTDRTGTVPVAVPGLIRASWWPLPLSPVFKSPPEGATHVFRKDDPILQVIVVPADPEIALEPMSEEEAAERELQERRILLNRDRLAERSAWTSKFGIQFDGTYRHMARAARAEPRPR